MSRQVALTVRSGGLAEQGFELREQLLDRIEVWTVRLFHKIRPQRSIGG